MLSLTCVAPPSLAGLTGKFCVTAAEADAYALLAASTGMSGGGGDDISSRTSDCLKLDGTSRCVNGDVCLFGLGICAPPRTTTACNPPCINGAVCNLFASTCVAPPTTTPPVCTACPDSRCIRPLFPGQPVTCVSSQLCSQDSACSGESKCVQGHCLACGDFCAGDLAAVIGSLVGANFNLSKVTVRLPADSASRMEGGQLIPPPGSLLQLDASAAFQALQQIRFNAGNDNAGAQLTAGQTLHVPRIESGSQSGRLVVGAAAQLTGAILVNASSALTLALARTGDGALERTTARMSTLSLQGPLNVVGDSSTTFAFPQRASDASFTLAGAVQLSGGVNVQGQSGPIPISIAGGATSGSAQRATVAAGQTFNAAGPILGTAATLAVQGSIELTGTVVEPLLQVYPGARATLRATGAAAVYCGNVTLQGSASRLVINGSSSNYGEKVFFKRFESCPPSAKISFNLAAGVSVESALAAGFVALNYAIDSAAPSFLCDVEVCDSAAANCATLLNSNVGIVGAQRRRLLQASAGTATFSQSQLSVEATKQSGATTNSAASTVSASLAIIAAAAAAIVAHRA